MAAGLVALLALAPGARPARADAPGDEPACADSIHDPIGIGVRDAGLDLGRGACGRDEVRIRLGGRAAIDTPAFYGALGGGLSIDARFTRAAWEWGVGADVLDVTFAQNAVIKATMSRLGPIHVHLARTGAVPGRVGQRLRGRWALALAGWLPYSEDDLDLAGGGGQLGATLSVVPQRRLTLHVRTHALGWITGSLAGRTRATAVAAGADLVVNTWSWLDLGAGVDAQAGWRGGFDHLLVRLAGHWRVFGPFRGELGGALRLIGDERTDLVIIAGVRRDL